MTKKDFIQEVSNKVGLPKSDVEKVLKATLGTIGDVLSKGDLIQFIGFGTFEVRERAARTGINPKTKEKITIPAKKVVAFKVGKKLKEAVE